MNEINPRVSVVMRSKNSDWVIHQALAALFSQTYQDWELLIVDSGSTDRTLDIIRDYPCRLMQIPAKAYYPGTVLNDAIAEARGEIILFQNSDAVPLAHNAMERLVKAFDDPQVHAALGRQIVRPEADTWVRRDYAVSFPESGPAPDWITLSLVYSAMRRATWEKHHFYQDAWGSEDTEWGNWAKQQGYRIKYVADCLVMHSHNYTLRQLYGRRFIEGEADSFIYNHALGLGDCALKTLSSIVRDIPPHLRAGDFRGLLATPVRRAVYQWAYLKGHQLGRHRQATNNKDRSIGQKAVLDRYDK